MNIALLRHKLRQQAHSSKWILNSQSGSMNVRRIWKRKILSIWCTVHQLQSCMVLSHIPVKSGGPFQNIVGGKFTILFSLVQCSLLLVLWWNCWFVFEPPGLWRQDRQLFMYCMLRMCSFLGIEEYIFWAFCNSTTFKCLIIFFVQVQDLFWHFFSSTSISFCRHIALNQQRAWWLWWTLQTELFIFCGLSKCVQIFFLFNAKCVLNHVHFVPALVSLVWTSFPSQIPFLKMKEQASFYPDTPSPGLIGNSKLP